MVKPSRVVHLGGDELREQRHVCALFEDQDSAATFLWPFIREGLEQSERVVHLVEDRDADRGRLAAAFEVAGAIESGQLEIRTWDESYLADGRFVGSRMLATLRRLLREGRGKGYSATRLIGDMGWARDDVAGVDELATYEAGVDGLLGRTDVVVCAYDIQRLSARRLAAVQAAHRAVFVGGRLQRTSEASDEASPRDRILAAAARLFEESGVRATSVDALIASAGVAKATFYRHFPSKEALIVAWLEGPLTRWFDNVRIAAEGRAASPDALLFEFFGAVAEWLERDDFRGCPYLNTTVELTDRGTEATRVIRDRLHEIEGYLQERVAAAGYQNPAPLGTALQTLLAGSISLAVTHRDSSFVFTAREAAVQLLATADRTAWGDVRVRSEARDDAPGAEAPRGRGRPRPRQRRRPA